MIEMYLNDNLVDLTGVTSVEYTKNFEEISDPTKIKTEWTKTINLPRTSQNDIVFNNIFRVDNTSLDFNPLHKIDLKMYHNSDLFIVGYAKLSSVTKLSYEVNLNSSVANTINELNKLTVDKFDASECNTLLNKEFVIACQTNKNNGKSHKLNSKLPEDNIGMMITNRGEYTSFNSDIVYKNYKENEVDLTLGEFDTDDTYKTAIEFRSYYQRPYIWMSKLFDIIVQKSKEYDYPLVLDTEVFNEDNPYYMDAVYTAETLKLDGISTVNNTLKSVSNQNVVVGIQSPMWFIDPENVLIPNGVLSRNFVLPTSTDSRAVLEDGKINLLLHLKGSASGIINLDLTTIGAKVYSSGLVLNLRIVDDLTAVCLSTLKILFINEKATEIPDGYESSTVKVKGSSMTYEAGKPVVKFTDQLGNLSINLPTSIQSILTNKSNNLHYTSEIVPSTSFLYNGVFVNTAAILRTNMGQAVSFKNGEPNQVSSKLIDIKLSHSLNNNSRRSNSELTLLRMFGKEWKPMETFLAYGKMLGLHYVQDNINKVIKVTTRKEVLKDPVILDWSAKLDTTDEYKIIPVSWGKKYIEFNMKEDETDYNEAYNNLTGVNFGSKEIETALDFNTDKLELFKDVKTNIVSSEKYVYLDDNTPYAGSMRTELPTFFNLDAGNSRQHLAKGNSFLLFDNYDYFSGTMPSSSGLAEGVGEPDDYIITDDVTTLRANGEAIEPCWNQNIINKYHTFKRFDYSKYDDSNYKQYYMTFAIPRISFKSDETIKVKRGEITTLYSYDWGTYIEDRYSANSKMLECELYLTLDDWKNFKWNNFVYVNGAIFMVNQIENFDILGNNKPTKCKLIKVDNPDIYKYGLLPDNLELSAGIDDTYIATEITSKSEPNVDIFDNKDSILSTTVSIVNTSTDRYYIKFNFNAKYISGEAIVRISQGFKTFYINITKS